MSEETIFTTALDKRTPAERSAFLDEACGGDAALRQRVEALIAAHEQADNFLELPVLEQIAAGEAPAREPTDAIRGAADGIAEMPADPLLGPTQAEPSADSADQASLDFLAPSDRPGALGRIDHYHVLAVIGHGGMGVVLKAFDDVLQRVAAIKVMRPQLAATASARKRFIREAQAAAAVRDEHVIDIHAVNEASDLPYLVMEYVNGISLQDRLNQSGPLELKEILRIGMQMATGLAKAHAQGLIHRDIKPANILLENGVQRVKITDFGLARAVDDASLTQSGVIAGTPQYMAPEQACGESIDHRADLFSLGSVLYAMCTGRPPFRASTVMAVLKRVSEDTPRPIREINPDIPDWLCAIVEKLHAKDPAQRFASAQEIADLLGQHLHHLQQPDAVPRPPRVARPVLPQPRKRPRALYWAAGCMVGMICGFLCCLGVPLLLYVVPIGGSGKEVSITSKVRVERGPSVVPQARPLPRSAPVKPKEEIHQDQFTEIRRFKGSHLSPITSVAVSPDGTYLLSASYDQTVRLWEMETGKEVRPFLGHNRSVPSVAFSPDGKWALSGGMDGTLRLWDVKTGELVRRFEGHTGWVRAAAFSPDGQFVVSGSADYRSQKNECDHSLRLWDVGTGKELRRMEGKGQMQSINSVAFSPNGQFVLFGGEYKMVGTWDVRTGKLLKQVSQPSANTKCVAISPDGRIAASGHVWAAKDSFRDGKLFDPEHHVVCLWDVKTGRLIRTLHGHSGAVNAVAFSPDGRYVLSGSGGCHHNRKPPYSAAEDNTLRLWDVETGKELLRVETGTCINSVAFTPDGRCVVSGGGELALGGGDDKPDLRLWRLPENLSHTQAAALTPFVILANGGKTERKFTTLAKAVATASRGDTIEVRGDGPFWIDASGLRIKKPLTIRAGAGCRPLFKLAQAGAGQIRNKHILGLYAPITLEGLDFDRSGEHEGATRERAVLYVQNGPLHMANCRLRTGGQAHYLVWLSSVSQANIRNCLFGGDSNAAIVAAACGTKDEIAISHCIFAVAPYAFIVNEEQLDVASSLRLYLSHNTLASVPLCRYHRSRTRIQVEAEGNIVAGHALLRVWGPPRAIPWNEAVKKLDWVGRQNLYPVGVPLVLLHTTPLAEASSLEAWNRLWEKPEEGSRTGTPKFKGGDALRWSPVAGEADFWRLMPDSAGKGVGPSGCDLGAAVDLVGPGPAYERWKQRPEYEAWRKKTEGRMGEW